MFLNEISGGDSEFETELLSEYLENSTELLTSISEAFQNGDAYGLELSAHTLKGSSRSIGANETADLAARIEACAKSGNLAGDERLLAGLHDNVLALQAFLREHMRRKAA